MANLASAIDAWMAAIGPEHVLTEAGDLAAYHRATFPTRQRIVGVLRPANREEVQRCVRTANEHRVPLYPVSRGKNWGLGSRVPVRDGSVVLDLGRLDKIVEFDEELGYVTVQPGVSFTRLSRFLADRRSKFITTIVGSTGEASVVGNVLERGHGQGPYADRFAHSCAFEIVLPNGDCIHSGLGRFEGAHAAPLHRSGFGPAIDGLFTQSNLGIVTQLTLWLMPRPKYLQIGVAVSPDGQLPQLVDALRTLGLDERNHVQLERLPRPTGFPASLLLRYLVPDARDAVWFAIIALYADSVEEGAARTRAIRRAWPSALRKPWFFDRPSTARLLSPNLAELVDPNESTFLGNPPKRQTLWINHDYDRSDHGVVWCCPVVPFRGDHVLRLARIVDDVREPGLHQRLALRPAGGRALDGVVGAAYDRNESGAAERAMAFHDRLLRRFNEEGYVPYRLGIHSMDAVPPPTDDYAGFMRTLKRALDPNDILSPGRYDARSHWGASEGDGAS